MTPRKWIISALTLIILLIAGTVTWYYFKFQEKNKILEYVPKEADIVVYFNFKKLFLKGLEKSDKDRFKILKTKLEKINYLPKFDELKSAGLDPFGDAVFFLKGKTPYLAFLLEDVEKFENLILKRYGEFYSPNENSENWKDYRSRDNKINFLWNDKIVYLRFPNEQAQQAFKLIASENSFGKTADCKLSENLDSPIWFYSKINPFGNDGAVKGTIAFENSLDLHIRGLNDTSVSILEIPTLNNPYEALFLSDSSHSKINGFIEAIFTTYSLNDSKADPIFLKKHADKNLLLYDGHQSQVTEYEKYVYNDNFEKVLQITRSVKDVHGFAYIKSWEDGKSEINTNYDFKDILFINTFDKNTTHYISFDNKFISKFYQTDVPFKVILIGKQVDGRKSYRIKLELTSNNELKQ